MKIVNMMNLKKMIIVINVMIPNLEVQDVLEKVVVNI